MGSQIEYQNEKLLKMYVEFCESAIGLKAAFQSFMATIERLDETCKQSRAIIAGIEGKRNGK